MNILMFCSNPVNGGTARIFYELTTVFGNFLSYDDKLYACINQDNLVEVYKKIENLRRLPVFSAEEQFADLYGSKGLERFVKGVLRRIKYKKTKRNNIDIMKRFLVEKSIDAVIIHNGGYVGDDLCNQMLTAAYFCADIVSHRIFVLHNDFEKNILSKLRYKSYDRKISKEATDLVTVSNYTRKRILESSFIKKDIAVIYNGITVKPEMTDAEKLEKICVQQDKRNILMIGNFAKNKGQRLFIEVARKLLQRNSNLHFTIIGNPYDKVYFEDCINYIKEQKIEKDFSIYHGINNASEYIDLFEILVVPSLYDESFGLISIEAMASGRPVVAFAIGGIVEVVQNMYNGLLVPVGDVRKMSETINWLLEHPDKCIEMGKNGQIDYKERFSVEAMAKQYFNILKNGCIN